VMQARVFPTCPSVLRELGDRQRLRMLTAVGTPKDSQAQPSATPTLTYGEGELLSTRLALISTGYSVQKTARLERRGWPRRRRSARCLYPGGG
jgi:hypothetical protein